MTPILRRLDHLNRQFPAAASRCLAVGALWRAAVVRRGTVGVLSASILFATVLLMTFSMVPFFALAAGDKVWRITYGHLSLTKIEAFIKPDALRIEFTTPKFAVIARAPDWKTVWFSETAKAYSEKSLDQFCRDGIAPEFPIDELRALKKTTKTSESTFEGVGTISATYPANFVREMNMFSVMTEEKHAKIRKVVFRATRTGSIPTSAGVVKFFRGLYRTPELGQIPLDLWYANHTGGESNVFYTTAIKQVSVPSSFFNVPTGLRKSSNPYDVLGHEKLQEIEDWASEMGVGDELGKGKGKGSGTNKGTAKPSGTSTHQF